MARRQLVSCVSPAPTRPTTPLRYSNQAHTNAWDEVLEISKEGFANKMRTLGQEIQQNVKNELQQALTAFREEISNIAEAQQKQTETKVESVLEKVMKEQAGKQIDLFKKLIKDEMAHQSKSALDKLEHLEERIASVSSQMEEFRGQSSAMFHQLSNALIGESFQKSLLQSLDCEDSSLRHRLDASNGAIRGLEMQTASIVATLEESGSRVLEKLCRIDQQIEQTSLAVLGGSGSFGGIQMNSLLDEEKRTQRVMHDEFNLLLSELSKVQQAMHLDFLTVVDVHRKAAIEDAGKDQPTQSMGPTHSMNHRRSILQGDHDHHVHHRVRKRIREFSVQTEAINSVEAGAQTDPKMMKKKISQPGIRMSQIPQVRQFAHSNDGLKKQARQALIFRAMHVFDLYHDSGWAQRIAKSPYFENFTLAMVIANVIWIAVDSDHNDAAFLIDANPLFIVAENLFCFYFTFEAAVRFAAFSKKISCIKDWWFPFDTIICLLMILDTWILPIIMIATGKRSGLSNVNVSLLRMIRIIKLLRLSRMARIIQAIPELAIVSKGIIYAGRSVLTFILIWLIVVYAFACLLRQLTDGNDIGHRYFESIPDSISTLLLSGLFPENKHFIDDISSQMPYLWPIIVAFLFLVSITVMYMLVGILVSIIGIIATVEKEEIQVKWLAHSLRERLEWLGYSADSSFTRAELEQLLVQPMVARTIASAGADVVAIVDMLDMVYDDLERKELPPSVNFEGIVELILEMRMSNPATVKDTKEQIRITKTLIRDSTDDIIMKMAEEFAQVNANVRTLLEEALSKDEGYMISEVGSEADADLE